MTWQLLSVCTTSHDATMPMCHVMYALATSYDAMELNKLRITIPLVTWWRAILACPYRGLLIVHGRHAGGRPEVYGRNSKQHVNALHRISCPSTQPYAGFNLHRPTYVQTNSVVVLRVREPLL